MKKLFLIISLSLPFLGLQAREDAAIASYKKTCKKCHGGAYSVAKTRTIEQWEELFENDAEKFDKLHSSDKKAMKKLNSSYYKKRKESLQHFILHNAKDSGTIPPCNSTTCGFDLRNIKKTESETKK